MTSQTKPQAKSAWLLDPAHTSVEFAVKHMVITTVKGQFAKFDVKADFDEVSPQRSQVEAQIEAASIDTREPRRDAHLRSPDFLDAERFPLITFKSRRIDPKGDSRYKIIGDLTIRDVTREVALDTTFSGVAKDPMGNLHAGFSAETTVNRKEFGATWNMPLETGGVLVGDSVKISIELELVKQS